MLKSKLVQRLLQLLIALVGAGLGVAATMGGLEIYRWLYPTKSMQLLPLALGYIITASIGALIFYLLSDRMIKRFVDVCGALERYLDKLTITQLTASITGLLAGMMVAALLSQILTFMGDSIFTTATSGILYVVLGLTGFSVGRRRGNDPSLSEKSQRIFRRKGKPAEEPLCPKLMDLSTLVDGRIADVLHSGFLEGELLLPSFAAAELTRMAGASDSFQRIRGQHGLEVLRKLQADESICLRTVDANSSESSGLDAAFLRLAQSLNAAVITCDASMAKVASLSGLRVLNLSALAAALRPVLLPGEELTVQIMKEGKEASQGVGYLPDGTMIVVEGARAMVGLTIPVIVTSSLQTNAGRMIFARVKDTSADKKSQNFHFPG